MRWPHRPDDGGPRWPWRAEFGRVQARGAPRGLTWRELAGTFSGPDGESAADGAPSGWEWYGSQSSEGATELGFPGPALGRCRVRRRAEWVSRPAREKSHRRRVLVVTICAPRPMRAVQRARLWAMTPYRVRGRLCTASQAALAEKRPEGRWLSPRRTSGRGWRSRSRRGGDGRPPVPGCLPPGR